MSVKSAFLAEDVRTMWTNNTIHIVFFAHVRGKIRNLLVALRTGQVLQAGHVHLEPVDVEGGLGGELLLAVRALPRRARVAQHGLAAASGLGLSSGRLLAGHRRRGQLDIDIGYCRYNI